MDDVTGEEVPLGCPLVTGRGEAVPRAEGRGPLATVLEAGEVVVGEDMLREAREGSWRERARRGQRKPAEKNVVQPCEVPESCEEKWQVYCVQKASLVGCG